jgi:4-aminobutyrate aminotransferase-like enzyme
VTPAMAEVRKAILARRVWPLFRWNLIGLTPPLTLSEAELDEGLAAVEAGLTAADLALA